MMYDSPKPCQQGRMCFVVCPGCEDIERLPKPPAQSCGTCKWLADPLDMFERWYILFRCGAPVPDSASRWHGVNAHDGTTCPCYVPRATSPASGPQRPPEPGFMPEWSHE